MENSNQGARKYKKSRPTKPRNTDSEKKTNERVATEPVKNGEKKPYKKPYNNKNNKNRPKKQYNKPKQDMSTNPVATIEETVNENLLFGRNSVIEVLKSGRDIEKLLVQKGASEGSINKIIAEAKKAGVIVQEVEKSKLDEISNMEKHQGVAAYVSAHGYSTVEDILEEAAKKNEDPFIIILDNIQDPHNLGAIIRSAHNAGVHGIIIPKRRAVGLTATVSKSSAGAIEYMKVAKVSNIAQTIDKLKEKGVWVACADMDGEVIFTDNMRGPIGIVIGSEGEGISRIVKNKCDFVVKIPMYGKVTSLNASVAASILAYEVVRQRHF